MKNSEQKQRVLVVDDDELVRFTLKQVLEQASYLVSVADDGDGALELMAQDNFEVVVTDVIMPGMSGIELLSRIRKLNDRTMVIIITGEPNINAAVESMKLGADDYISKPFNVDKIIESVARAFAKIRNASNQTNDETIVLENGMGTIGGYTVISKISEGNKGEVFLAKKIEDGEIRQFALKTIKFTDATESEKYKTLERFNREAQVAAKIQHPNIVKILDYGLSTEEPIPYIVMEYLDGKSLKKLINNKVLSFSDKLEIIQQVASALQEIHANGICHRDIKPENIMIGESLTVKVMDFGVAKTIESQLTLTGDLLGTPNYLSPEAFKSSDIDHRADLFALGVIAYELFVGRRPFNGDNLFHLAHVISTDRPIKPQTIVPDFPAKLQVILAKMLKKDPAERYETAGGIIIDIDEFSADDCEASPLSESAEDRYVEDWS